MRKQIAKEVLYRYEEITYSNGLDEWDNPLPGPGRMELELNEFRILKRTPKGAWIAVWDETKFVNLTARKKYACETIEDAKESFLARKERQISILSARLKEAKRAKHLMETGTDCELGILP